MGASNMPAAVYQGQRTVTVEQLPVPEVPSGHVLVEVSHCGICGSDLHFMMEDWSQPGAVHGHEYSGEIVALGSDVTDWTLGERVVAGPGHGCGTCPPCLEGRSNLCVAKERAGIDAHQGAFAAYKLIDTGSLFRIPPGLELRTAALSEPLAVALRGVRRAGLVAGQRVLITGAGPIGLLSVAVLRAFGVDDVTVSEPGERRRSLALAVGATQTVLPDELVTPGLPMDLVDRPYDAAIECSGRPDAMEAALGQLGRGGALVLSGTGMRRPKFDHNRIILNELIITGSVEYTREDFADAITLLADGRLPVEKLIEPGDVPLGQLQFAMEQLVAGELAGKVMVIPHA